MTQDIFRPLCFSLSFLSFLFFLSLMTEIEQKNFAATFIMELGAYVVAYLEPG